MHFYKKQYFVTLYVALSNLRTWKWSTKLYESYKSLINYQKDSNIKDKIKTNVCFDNTFTVNDKLVINYNYVTSKQIKGRVLKLSNTF